MTPAKKPVPSPEEVDAHIAKLSEEFAAATSLPAKRRTAKPSQSAADPKATCRWGSGRYYSPPNEPDCKLPRAKGKQLCGPEGKNHEAAMAAARKAAKEAGTAKVGTPRVKTATPAPAEPKKPARPPRNSGGGKRSVRPPAPEMHQGPIARGDVIPMPIAALSASAE